jgi:hypothetical protein
MVADSACLAAATIVKTQGMPFDGSKPDEARYIAKANHPGMEFDIAITANETLTQVTLTCQAVVKVSAPALIWAGGQLMVRADATASVAQTTLDNATRMVPKLMLVLDYSGSMNNYKLLNDPSGRTTFQALIDEVHKLLAMPYKMELGVVIFANKIYGKDAVALNNTQKVSADVDKHYPCPWNDGEDCETYSWDALKTAHQLYGPWDGGEERYVLFISDGQPADGSTDPGTLISKTEKEADGLFTDAHTNIITLQLKNGPDTDGSLQAFMQDISGSWDHHPDPCNYFNADSQAKLDSLFTTIGNMIACPLKLDHPPPANTAVHVFLADGSGAEEVLGDASQIPLCSGAPACGQTVGSKYATLPGDLADESNCTYYQGDYFLYYAPRQSIFVTPNVCDKLINNDYTVIVRSARPVLTQ